MLTCYNYGGGLFGVSGGVTWWLHHPRGQRGAESRLLHLFGGDLPLWGLHHKEAVFVSDSLREFLAAFQSEPGIKMRVSCLYTNSRQIFVLQGRSLPGLTEQSQFAPFV